MKPQAIIADFDAFLAKKGLSFQGVAIGATALALLGVISRETQDCDILDPEIPASIRMASEEFAAMKRKAGMVLKDDWLNNGPESLRRNLPNGWLKRCKGIFSGEALTILSLGREDLLKTKLFAYCDRQTDLEDCIALKPTQPELQSALKWVQDQDTNVDWPRHVARAFEELAARLGHEL